MWITVSVLRLKNTILCLNRGINDKKISMDLLQSHAFNQIMKKNPSYSSGFITTLTCPSNNDLNVFASTRVPSAGP